VTAPSALARLGGAARREAGFIATSRVMLLALVVVPFCAIAIVAAMLSQGALQALPVAVVDNARTSESQALVRLLSGRPEVRIAAQPVSDAAAEAAMRRGQIWAFVSIPRGFGQLRAADEPIRLYYNAAYLSVGSTVERSLATALRGSIIAGIEDNAWRAGVLSDRAAIPQVQISVLFNPEASFEWYLQALIQPAMLHLLAACVGVYAMARELGGPDGRSLDAWRAETGGGAAALTGKLVPYLTVLSFWGAVWMVWLVGFKGWRMEGSLLATFAAQLALIAASLALSFGFVAGARRDVFGYSLSALYAGSALAYSGGSLPIEGAPTVARFWHQVLPFTHYLTAQMDQFLGAPARQAWGAALLLTGYAAAGLALATWLGGRKSPA